MASRISNIIMEGEKYKDYLNGYESRLLLVTHIQCWKAWVLQGVRVHLKVVCLHRYVLFSYITSIIFDPLGEPVPTSVSDK